MVKQFQTDAQDDDYEINIEYKPPVATKKGYIRLVAEDMDFNRSEVELFPLATRVSFQTKEIECEDEFTYYPELTLWF